MKLLFRPAEALMNRFNYPVKFGLLGLLVFVAFASLMLTVVGQLQRTIERSAEELQATALARPGVPAGRADPSSIGGCRRCCSEANPAVTAKTRRARVRCRGGAGRAERRASRRTAAAAELAGDSPGWGEIRRDGLGWTQARNMRAHTELIQSMLRFNTELADAYGLTFDPEAESYYLMAAALDEVPYLIERIGRLRGSASAALAHGSMGDEQRVG